MLETITGGRVKCRSFDKNDAKNVIQTNILTALLVLCFY